MAILDIVPFGRRRQYTPPPAPADRERDPVGALQSDIDRAFENFWSMVSFPMTSSLAGEMFERRQPPDFQVDVRDTGNQVEITAELPGLRPDDVDVSVGPDSVVIRAERREDHAERRQGMLVRERRYGRLERIVPLPQGIDADAAEARFKDGVLTIVIPKSADASSNSRNIPVQAD